MTIYFDMDGTLVDFYSVPGWLDMLIDEDATPYLIAKPLLNLSRLARLLNKLQKNGIKIGIISWGSKCASEEYDEIVKAAKEDWLAKHMPSVTWDEIHVTHYGINKWETCGDKGDAILFDDEERNRVLWENGYGLGPEFIFDVLNSLAKAF